MTQQILYEERMYARGIKTITLVKLHTLMDHAFLIGTFIVTGVPCERDYVHESEDI